MTLVHRQSRAKSRASAYYGPSSSRGHALLAAAFAERDRIRAHPPLDELGAASSLSE